MKTHDEVVKAPMGRSGVKAEVERIECEEGELLVAQLRSSVWQKSAVAYMFSGVYISDPSEDYLNVHTTLHTYCRSCVHRWPDGPADESGCGRAPCAGAPL